MVAISSEKDNLSEIANIYDSRTCFPDAIFVLENGIISFGKLSDGKFRTTSEDEDPDSNVFMVAKTDSRICFARLLNGLIAHLNNRYIEPYSISKYISDSELYGIRMSDVELFKISNDELS